MATTKAKESCGLGKERKITAPSSVTIPNNTPTKRTPKSSPRGIISSTDPKLSSFSSSSSSPSSSSSSAPSLSILPEKHVPNYLKSTASSRHDHNFRPITKSKSGPAPIPEGKPSLNRRRSFDKPPPTAPRLEKPFRSPGPRNRAGHVPVRSSSFGAKPSTTTTTTNTIVNSTKPGLLERSSSKVSKVGGKPQQPIQALKSSTSNVKKSLKREPSNAASASASASVSASASAEMIPKTKNAIEHVDQSPSFVLGVNEEDLKKIECELDPYLPDPMPELDKQLRIDQVEKNETDDTENFKVVVTNKEVEEETPEAAQTEMSLMNREQNEAEGDEEKTERITVEKEEVIASEENTNNKNDQEKSETDPILDGESYKEENDHKATETTEKEGEATDKVAAAVAAAKPQQGGPARKESPAMYNHVIEETASKLLEKRKNKVRALAGAFQTVIDYESSSK